MTSTKPTIASLSVDLAESNSKIGSLKAEVIRLGGMRTSINSQIESLSIRVTGVDLVVRKINTALLKMVVLYDNTQRTLQEVRHTAQRAAALNQETHLALAEIKKVKTPWYRRTPK